MSSIKRRISPLLTHESLVVASIAAASLIFFSYVVIYYLAPIFTEMPETPSVRKLSTADVDNLDRTTLVEFYAPWCHHCKAFAPVIEEAAQLRPGMIGNVDCTKNSEICSRFGIKAFPVLKMMHIDEDGNKIVYDFKKKRSLSGVLSFIDTYMEGNSVPYPLPKSADSKHTIPKFQESMTEKAHDQKDEPLPLKLNDAVAVVDSLGEKGMVQHLPYLPEVKSSSILFYIVLILVSFLLVLFAKRIFRKWLSDRKKQKK